MPSIYSQNKIRAQQGKAPICDCGKGYRSGYDHKCGHCRTRKEQQAYTELAKKGFSK